ncbi:MAG: hypothetical protein QXJ31_05480 [Candidatus Bathyarchaeia archaeon]
MDGYKEMGEKIKYKGNWISIEEYEKVMEPSRTTMHGGLSRKIPVSKIHESNLIYGEVDVEVVNSVSMEGYEYPIKVRPCNCPRISGPHYEILDGHNRFFGAKNGGQKEIACQVRNVDDFEAFDIMLRTDKVHKKSALWNALMIDAMVKTAAKKFGENGSKTLVAKKINPSNVESGKSMVSMAQRIANMVYSINDLLPSDSDIGFLDKNRNGQNIGGIKNGLEIKEYGLTVVNCNLINPKLLAALTGFTRNELLDLCSIMERDMDGWARVRIIENLIEHPDEFKKLYLEKLKSDSDRKFVDAVNQMQTQQVKKEEIPPANIFEGVGSAEVEEIESKQTKEIPTNRPQTTFQAQVTTAQQYKFNNLGKALEMQPKPNLKPFYISLQERINNTSKWILPICESKTTCNQCDIKKACERLRSEIKSLLDTFDKIFAKVYSRKSSM